MLERPDAVLLAVPLLAVGGIALRTTILATGVATGLLAAPLAAAGYLAAAGVVLWGLFGAPFRRESDDGRP